MTTLAPMSTSDQEVHYRVASLEGISLDHLNDAAALQTRVDRKYIIDGWQLSSLIAVLEGRLAALEIDGQRSFTYESVYFDTPNLESFRSAATKRRNRFKVRTRTYVDTTTSMLEVKTKGGRGGTIKTRQAHDFDRRRELDIGAVYFVDSLLDREGLAATLQPVLTTRYDRTTLVDLDDVARLTIDSGLCCSDPAGRSVGLDRYVVETKSTGAPSTADRQLWANGIRPAKISKFGTGMAALDPTLPSNKWNRTLNRHFR